MKSDMKDENSSGLLAPPAINVAPATESGSRTCACVCERAHGVCMIVWLHVFVLGRRVVAFVYVLLHVFRSDLVPFWESELGLD